MGCLVIAYQVYALCLLFVMLLLCNSSVMVGVRASLNVIAGVSIRKIQ